MVVEIFSQGIARLAVPIFFFISGFLFFQKVSSLSLELYRNKIKKRVRTLLVPYLLWNGILLVALIGLYFVGYPYSVMKNGFSCEVLFKTFVGSFHETGAFPLIYPLWFIRDLFCVCLISPLIYECIKILRLIFVFILGTVWILGGEIPILGYYMMSMSALFFFSLGSYFSLLNLSVSEIVHLHNLAILSGIIFVLWGTEYLLSHKNIAPIPFLSSATFFVFAIHEPILLSTIRKLCLRIIPVINTYTLVISYFISIGITTVVALGIYAVLRRICPKVLAVLNGGR